ncbi:MAG: transporter [Salinivenus sp.]
MAFAWAAGPQATHAQIAADRPGFGDGAAVVQPGTVQLGLGYALDRETGRAPGESVHEFGQVLLRTGLTRTVEVRGGVGSFKATGDGSGYEGASVGTKVRLLRTMSAMLSGVATTTLPVGTGEFAPNDRRARQEVKLAFDGMLGERLAFSANSGVSFAYDDGVRNDRDTEGLFIPTLAVGLSETTGAYVGYAGFYGKRDNRSWVEGGITFLPNPDTQFDVNTGLRVDGNVGTGFFVGLGLATRF